MERRIAVITGASAGIGRATAVEFGRNGWMVVLLARGAERLEGARRDVEAAGGQAFALQVDVADRVQVEAAAQRIEAELGPIEVWVNNAMATVFCDFAATAPEDFVRATEVTYHGVVWGTRAALQHMQPRNRGTIVQVGSALAYRSIPLQAAYCGAKSAVRGFTDSLRSELIHEKSRIHLTMVQLAAFNTPQFDWGRNGLGRRPRPVGKIFQPEIAARGIYWAATHRRREVWVGLPVFLAIVGTRFLPWYLDRKLAAEAWEGQLTAEPWPRGHPDNLHIAPPGDPGAHGRFDAEAKTRSPALWLSTHRGAMAAGGLLLAALFALNRSRTRSS